MESFLFNYEKHSLRYQGPHIWSKLDNTLKGSSNIESFKKNIRKKYLNVTLRSCSIGINLFRLVGLVELFRVLLAKNRFRLVWLLNFFNLHQTGLKRLRKHW